MGLFGIRNKKSSSNSINWVQFTNENQLGEFIEESKHTPVLFFKHSTRCSISAMAKYRLESDWDIENITPVYLDLLRYRPISNKLAEEFGVHHESPQVILIKDGMAVLDLSHSQITVNAIKKGL